MDIEIYIFIFFWVFITRPIKNNEREKLIYLILIGFERFDESFELTNGRLKAVGTRTGQTFKMGQKVRARILSTDLEKKTIELDIVEDE